MTKPHHTLWRAAGTRHFIVPDHTDLPVGSLVLRTATGRERSVDESAVLCFEVTADEAQAWTKQELSATLGDLRGNALEFVQSLRARTEELREENRKTWEEGVANAPPELRDATQRLRGWLRDLGQALQRAAREHGGDQPPRNEKPKPPEDPEAKPGSA